MGSLIEYRPGESEKADPDAGDGDIRLRQRAAIEEMAAIVDHYVRFFRYADRRIADAINRRLREASDE